MYNIYPPEKITELFKQLYETYRSAAFKFYKSVLKLKENQCAEKTLSLLSVSMGKEHNSTSGIYYKTTLNNIRHLIGKITLISCTCTQHWKS